MCIQDKEKKRLMLLLQMRGKCAELEHKMSLFEANALKCSGVSLFRSMSFSMKSMEKDLEKWMDEFTDLTVEWRGFND